MDSNKRRKVVHKIEPGMDKDEILCTTYIMRNIFSSFGTGYFDNLDVMNLLVHHKACLMAKKGQHVLDVCCGRGTQLPLLRWYRKDIASYTGVDISPQNIRQAIQKSANRDISELRLAPNAAGESEPYYPFPVHLVIGDVAELSTLVQGPFQHAMYKGIEHMHRDAGIRSLHELHKVMSPNGTVLLTSPNTPDKEDEFDTQYAAHLYEWDRAELQEAIEDAGFEVETEFGILARPKKYREELKESYPHLVPMFNALSEYLSNDWLFSIFPLLTPDIADEVALILRRLV